MKKYSQGIEQDIILKYFEGQQIGTYLDIGAYDPEVFSNTRALYELGWKGVLVEPAEMNYNVITNYFKDDKQIQVIKTCVGTFDGEVEFLDSGGDAIGTIDPSHALKWATGYGTKYTKVKSRIVTVNTLLKETMYNKFDFINIDVENYDFQVLSQFNLNEVGCRLVCVEYNGKEKEKFHGFFHRQQFRHIFSNGENLIYGK